MLNSSRIASIFTELDLLEALFGHIYRRELLLSKSKWHLPCNHSLDVNLSLNHSVGLEAKLARFGYAWLWLELLGKKVWLFCL